MKIILGIICGLVVLFAGGCAVMLVVAQATDEGGAVSKEKSETFTIN